MEGPRGDLYPERPRSVPSDMNHDDYCRNIMNFPADGWSDPFGDREFRYRDDGQCTILNPWDDGPKYIQFNVEDIQDVKGNRVFIDLNFGVGDFRQLVFSKQEADELAAMVNP